MKDVRRDLLENKEFKKDVPKNVKSRGRVSLRTPKTFKVKLIMVCFLSLVITSIYYVFTSNLLNPFIIFISLILIFLVYSFFKKRLGEYSRIKRMEDVFPDFLQLVSSNLRAGMTIDRAIILSSREEFVPLDKEILSMGKDIMTGKELSVALKEMAKRTGSRKIEKTIGLIVRSIHAGGNLSILLEQISSNMRERVFLEKRAASNVLMYVIFIFFAVGVGAPFLFGLSSIMVDVMGGMLLDLPDTATVQTGFQIQEVHLSTTFVIYFSLIFMIVLDIFASLILGLVNKGEEKEGLKFIIPLILLSITIFFLVRILLSGFFSGFFV